jgi:hypothetical protein
MDTDLQGNGIENGNEDMERPLAHRDTVPYMRNPIKLIKEWRWVIYSILIYFFLIEGIFLFIAALVLLGKNPTQYDLMLAAFIGFCQMEVYWFGRKARKELESEDQERFRTFSKIYLEMLVILLVVFLINFFIEGQIKFTDGFFSVEAICSIVLIVHIVVFRIYYSRVKHLSDYLQKYDITRKFFKTDNINDDAEGPSTIL